MKSRDSNARFGAVWAAMLCALAFGTSADDQGAAGPTPYPADKAAWPGTGVIRVFGWMKDNRASFWRARERDRHSIVFAGDSLTGSWRTLPQDFAGLKVANRGIGGDVSRGLLFRFEEDVLALQPRAIVLLIGTNDLTARQSAQQSLANIRAMLELARSHQPSTPVFLCTVPPSANPKARVDEAQRRKLNEELKAMASSADGITLVDLHSATATADGAPDPTYFQSDLLHFSPAGHARWRDLLRAAFREQGIG